MTSRASTNQQFDALQVLRALAAGLVVYQHAFANWAEKGIGQGAAPFIDHLGEFGVKLFFVISGFIIVHTASQVPQGWESAKTFWRRRIRRIVPLYWIVTTVYLAKNLLVGQSYSLPEVLGSYFFIPYLNPQGLVQPILGLGWSLNFEMFFYMLFGALLILPRRWHGPAVMALMTALAAARAAGWLGDGSSPHALYHWADSIVLYFVAGVAVSLLARWWRSGSRPMLRQDAAAVVSSALVIGFAFWSQAATEEQVLAWMPVACILPAVLCVAAHAQPCSRGWRWLVIAGDASYSTYLTHGLVMGPLARLLGRLGLSIGYYGFAILSLVVCTLAGYLVWRWVEKPLQARKGPRIGAATPGAFAGRPEPSLASVRR
jgi:exopolysaccharide production protein ExoZ